MLKLLISALVIVLFQLPIQSQWSLSYNSTGLCLAIDNHNDIYFGTWFGGVGKSTNSGASWDAPVNFFPGTSVISLCANGNTLYAGTTELKVFISNDYGLNWYQSTTGLLSKRINVLLAQHGTVYAGTPVGIFITTDNGISWTYQSAGSRKLYIRALLKYGSYLYVGTFSGLFKSTNDGVELIPVNIGLNTPDVTSLAEQNNNLFVSVYGGGVFRSSDKGLTWTEINNGMTNLNIAKIISNNNILYAGYGSGGVYVSTDDGDSWHTFNDGMSQPAYFYSLLAANGYLFAGTNPAIWRRSIIQITDVQAQQNIPSEFKLYQNYPNPFNPSTNIEYTLPKDAFVNLTVYDAVGKTVQILVNEKQTAGNHIEHFGNNVNSSGVYFYKLTADKFSETRKMVLVK